MKHHDLKCHSEHFQAVWDGIKTAELRKNDRDFQAGDELVLRDFDPELRRYTGRVIYANITHVLQGGPWLVEGYAMLSLELTGKVQW